MHFLIAAALAAAMAGSVSGHALMYGVWVNGADQGNGQNVYIRSPPNNSPVKDLASPTLACGVNGGKVAPQFVKAGAGDTLTFEWFHNTRGDDIIDPSHKGPIITYIAQFTEGDGTGPIWSKIAEDGFDSGRWAVDKLIANKGKIDFALPAGLAAGKYLVRQEIIAHHESDTTFNVNPARGAQFYPSCVQVEVGGSGSVIPNQAFDFNTGYTYSDPGIAFNLYGSFTSYPIPGPKVFAGTGGGGSNTTPAAKPTTTSVGVPVPTTTLVTVTTTTAPDAPAATATAYPAYPSQHLCPFRGRRERRMIPRGS